jgi:hypothetical protein
VDDWYDNRDRGHSNLDLSPFPQIQKISYTADDRKTNRDWAAQTTLLPHVVFGNSSTSAGINSGGSNVRMYYVHPQGLPFLYAEYTHNNVYMYPEHCDHRPGHNGTPNHGDVYPTNTPFVITSQGSSGSDQPFMHAVPFALAAFRPQVKAKLVQSGLLMPTLQMILRASNKNVKDAKEYLTGKAHPSVFDGQQVDVLKMVTMAHDITLETIPPIVQMKVVEEDSATPGVDFFEQGGSEKLADTPAVIARIYRAAAPSRRMVVSAEASLDINKRPLTYTWVVLQGDETKIKITPKNDAGSVAEILVQYPERRPIQPGSALESNRIEVGVFVNNGAYTSVPGFITWFSLDTEGRTYDDWGRLLEIGYGMGEEAMTIANWPAFFDLLKPGATLSAGGKLLLDQFTPKESDALKKAGEEYAAAHALVVATENKRILAEAAKDKADQDVKAQADAEVKAAAKAHDAAVKDEEAVLGKSRDGAKQGVKARVESALNGLAADPMFWPTHSVDLLADTDFGGKAILANAQKRLAGLGIMSDKGELTPLRPGNTPQTNLTRYEKAQLARFNADLIANIALHGIANSTWRENFLDVRLSGAKSWRDVYHYDDKGMKGWTRYDGQKPQEFDAGGSLILKKDPAGNPTTLQPVHYERQKGGNFAIKQVVGQ